MNDLQQLEESYLNTDALIYEYRRSISDIYKHKHITKYNRNRIIFHSYITLALVRDQKVRKSVEQYITDLLSYKEKYGFLYFLNTQKLLVPLHLVFNGELVIDPSQYTEIKNEIHNLASLFSCPDKNILFFKITLIEILYFLTILVNPHLNWITVDYILRGNKTHDYIISAKDRIIQKTWPVTVG